MFHDTNTGAQLLMQGYSDSINVHGQKGLGNAFRDSYKSFSQGLHDQQDLEQKRQANEYGQKTMDDRVGMMKEQHEGMKLSNEFDRRTMEDRVMQESHRTKGMALDNTGKRIQNNTNQMHYDDLKYQQKARNANALARYAADTAHQNLAKDYTGMEHANYQHQNYKEYNGKYYDSITKNKKGNLVFGKEISLAEKERRDQHNAKVDERRGNYTSQYDMRDRANVAGEQARFSSNMIQARVNNNAISLMNTQDTLMKEKGITPYDIARERAKGNMPNNVFTDTDGTEIVDTYGQYSQNPTLAGGGGTQVNVGDRKALAEKYQAAILTLNNPNATQQEREAADALIVQLPGVKNFRKAMGHYENSYQGLLDLSQKDRAEAVLGWLTSYVGGDAAKEFGYLQARQKQVLVDLATAAQKGALSQKDMDLAKATVPNLWQSNATTLGKVEASLGKIIAAIENEADSVGGIGVLTPRQQETYKMMKNYYTLLRHGRTQE